MFETLTVKKPLVIRNLIKNGIITLALFDQQFRLENQGLLISLSLA